MLAASKAVGTATGAMAALGAAYALLAANAPRCSQSCYFAFTVVAALTLPLPFFAPSACLAHLPAGWRPSAPAILNWTGASPLKVCTGSSRPVPPQLSWATAAVLGHRSSPAVARSSGQRQAPAAVDWR